ncbi:histamine N-methyltransferase A-like [Antedon mediterranea]|uniref:histamine N-methyltransferase A-like n=1 Tax=Antedon mediterranea TaxID=105859 RepID=UPI003AF50059
MEKLIPIWSDQERCAESYLVYWNVSRNGEAFQNWINSYFPATIMKEIQVEKEMELTVLGVGSGPGQTECLVLQQLLKQWPKIRDTVVEPDLSYINKYQDLAALKPELIDKVSFEWRQQTLQQFRQETQDQPMKKYHFIMLFHVLYYYQDLADVLKYLMSILEDGGMILAMMESDDSCIPQIQRKLAQFKNNIYPLSTRDVEKALTKLQIQFVKHHIQLKMDATSCFDGKSKEGELLLEFLTKSAFFKETASKSLYCDVIEYLKSIALPESEDGKIWIRCDSDAIVITK